MTRNTTKEDKKITTDEKGPYAHLMQSISGIRVYAIEELPKGRLENTPYVFTKDDSPGLALYTRSQSGILFMVQAMAKTEWDEENDLHNISCMSYFDCESILSNAKWVFCAFTPLVEGVMKLINEQADSEKETLLQVVQFWIDEYGSYMLTEGSDIQETWYGINDANSFFRTLASATLN